MTKIQVHNIEALEASLYLKITVNALTQLANNGKIPYKQIGKNKLFCRADLSKFKNENKA